MKIEITRAHFVPALVLASKAITKNHSVPILEHVRLTPAGAGLTVQATDMEVAAIDTIPAVCSDTGDITVPLKPVLTFVKSLPKDAAISLETSEDGESVTLRSGYREGTFKTLPASDFPSLADFKSNAFKMAAADLHRLIYMVRPAISTEETRYYLNGVYLHIAEQHGASVLRSAACDGHRLMVADMDLPHGLKAEWFPKDKGPGRGHLIPKDSIPAIFELLGKKPSGDVEVMVGENRIGFRVREKRVLSKVIDGSFPDYERVIPRYNDRTLTIDAGECAALTKAVSSVDMSWNRAVKFELGDVVHLSARDAEGGNARSVMSGVTRYSGEEMAIGFNPRYIQQMLGVLNGLTHVALADSSGPAVFKSEDDPRWTGVLMPVRV